MAKSENSLASSAYTRIKNHYEAIRSDIVNCFSSEHECACCNSKYSQYPNIKKVWSQEDYKFLENAYSPDDANDANGNLRVHPNLWDNGASNLLSGVFEVLPDKIYQVRGYDMSNMTFVRSNPDESVPRWIVMDTLMSNECTEAAMCLFNDFLVQKFGQTEYKKSTKQRIRNQLIKGYIVGMIISHSHIDHYGGMETVEKYFIDEKAAAGIQGLTRFIIAPVGFYDHAVSENVYLGNAMGRRASYQYGSFIKPTYKGKNTDVDKYTSGEICIGIGQGQSTGTPSAVGRPTLEIDKNKRMNLDGIEVEFQLTPGTEAPAEMNNYFPKYKALWLAENCSGTLHNLYTLRGAEVRDAKAWAGYLMETAHLFGGKDKTDVIFQSHNWPHWRNLKDSKGKTIAKVDIRKFIIDTASIYKYIHDQTLLYMNMGYKMDEVADMLVLPRGMQKNWSLKPFYGTPVHNAKAVYQKYLGWYDANPIHLQELPPEQLAKEMMRYMQAGSKDKMLSMIEDDIAAGNYWTAAYMANQMILAFGKDECVADAKKLCAFALLQLGYQCESGTWRNAYLSAAYELSQGKNHAEKTSANSLGQMPPETLLDYISIFFDGERAASKVSCDMYLKVVEDNRKINVLNSTYFMFVVKNGAILYHKVEDRKEIDQISGSAISVTLDDLRAVAIGKYNGSCQILSQISNAMVSINCDRFKFFDIVDRHDGEVLLENGKRVDLSSVVKECIQLLETYDQNYISTSPIKLSKEDTLKWKEYYSILKNQTHVILGMDFFTPGGDETKGFGLDGKIMAHELYYTLYGLYRYLCRGYLKNDLGFKHVGQSNSEIFTKLKCSIALLESYVADGYLCTADDRVVLDPADYKAFVYLEYGYEGPTKNRFLLMFFFKEIFTRYRNLSKILRISC